MSAVDTMEKGKDLDRVREELAEAKGFFQKSVDASQLARTTFSVALAARAAAEKAESAKYAERDWERAEEALTGAAATLEGGNLNKATKEAGDALERYRETETEGDRRQGARRAVTRAPPRTERSPMRWPSSPIAWVALAALGGLPTDGRHRGARRAPAGGVETCAPRAPTLSNGTITGEPWRLVAIRRPGAAEEPVGPEPTYTVAVRSTTAAIRAERTATASRARTSLPSAGSCEFAPARRRSPRARRRRSPTSTCARSPPSRTTASAANELLLTYNTGGAARSSCASRSKRPRRPRSDARSSSTATVT